MGRMGPGAREQRLEAEHRFGGNRDPKLQHLLPGRFFKFYFFFSPLLGGGFGSRRDPAAVVGNRLLPEAS